MPEIYENTNDLVEAISSKMLTIVSGVLNICMRNVSDEARTAILQAGLQIAVSAARFAVQTFANGTPSACSGVLALTPEQMGAQASEVIFRQMKTDIAATTTEPEEMADYDKLNAQEFVNRMSDWDHVIARSICSALGLEVGFLQHRQVLRAIIPAAIHAFRNGAAFALTPGSAVTDVTARVLAGPVGPLVDRVSAALSRTIAARAMQKDE